FVFPLPAAAENQPMFRVMSFNIDSATAGSATVMAAIDAQHPDIAVPVEAPQASRQIDALVAARYPYVHRDSQFLIGSKLPLVEASQLPRVTYLGRSRTSRAVRYRLD